MKTTMPTPGAIRAAQIITQRIITEEKEFFIWTPLISKKTVEAFADLIDRETALPDLLEAAKTALQAMQDCYNAPMGHIHIALGPINNLEAAIAKTEGR